jgi:F-type H+-transporting ATPase subunit a
MHYTYLTPILPDENWQKLVVAVAVGGGLCLMGRLCSSRLKTDPQIEAAIVPGSKVSLFGLRDLFVEGFTKLYDSILGKENRQHLPFVGAIFLFILTANLVSLVPGVPASTTTVWVNVAMALTVFVYFNYQGIRAHGLLGYLRHFCGPSGLSPLVAVCVGLFMFPVEIISTCLRVLTLNLRLYWNINADHLVLGIFTDLISYGVPAPFYVLGLFVSVMQAFIFTVLTMVYIQLATGH